MVEKFNDELVNIVVDEAEGIKAVNVEVYDVRAKAAIVDFFVICTGTSSVHVESIARHICDGLDTAKESYLLDGTKGSNWIVIDSGPVIVHVMGVHEREKYNLEEIWRKKSSVIYHS